MVPKLRFPEFDNLPGWELRQLSDVLDYEQPGKYIVRDASYHKAGTPVLTANKSFILGHTGETDGIYHNVPVIIFDDFTTDAKHVDFSFKVKSSAIKILKLRGDDELRLVYELMSGIRFDPTQHKRYWISQYQHLEIPLPCKSEQRKIADCLGSLDDLIAAVGRKLEALRQHKKGLMQQLFPQPGETVPRLPVVIGRNDCGARTEDRSLEAAQARADAAAFSLRRGGKGVSKKIIMIAGPNGAGKTTFARTFLPEEMDFHRFINADLIAAGLSPFAPEIAAIKAGRLLLEEIDACVRGGESFAFETTLSGLGYLRLIPQWQRKGYRVSLFFLALPDEGSAIARVAERVRHGGHSIPEAVIRRRFSKGLENFENRYKAIVDAWMKIDNSGGKPVLMESGDNQ